jgi:hypothetical protein
MFLAPASFTNSSIMAVIQPEENVQVVRRILYRLLGMALPSLGCLAHAA